MTWLLSLAKQQEPSCGQCAAAVANVLTTIAEEKVGSSSLATGICLSHDVFLSLRKRCCGRRGGWGRENGY